MGKAIKHSAILTTVPLKEHLTWTEDARNAVNRYIAMLKYVQIVIPELVFDEERHYRADRTQKSASIGNCV